MHGCDGRVTCLAAVLVSLDQVTPILNEADGNITLTVLKEGTNYRPFTVNVVTLQITAQGEHPSVSLSVRPSAFVGLSILPSHILL